MTQEIWWFAANVAESTAGRQREMRGYAKCGKCGVRLFSGHPEDVDAEIFDRQIRRSSLPVVVDIWAPSCGPCKMMAPAYQTAANELPPYVRLIKLNSDNEQAIAASLGIRGIPTMILFHGGRELARTPGAMTSCADRQVGSRPSADGHGLKAATPWIRS